MQKLKQFFSDFARDESGAQVVEYALIIALVSIGVTVALATTAGGSGLIGSFTTLVTRITTCFTAGATCS